MKRFACAPMAKAECSGVRWPEEASEDRQSAMKKMKKDEESNGFMDVVPLATFEYL